MDYSGIVHNRHGMAVTVIGSVLAAVDFGNW
jgi:hypothetical protein